MTPPVNPPLPAKPRSPGGPVFWSGVVVGWAVMAAGVRGLLADHVASNPSWVARLLLGAALVHDLVLAPIVCLVGILLARLLAPPLRALVQGGLLASAVVTFYAFPFVRGYGRTPTNPTALTVNYGRGLVIVLVGIWLVVAALALWRLRRSQAPTRAF